jgi:hypothetical protein
VVNFEQPGMSERGIFIGHGRHRIRQVARALQERWELSCGEATQAAARSVTESEALEGDSFVMRRLAVCESEHCLYEINQGFFHGCELDSQAGFRRQGRARFQ